MKRGAAQNAERRECRMKFWPECRHAVMPNAQSALCARVGMPKVLTPNLGLRGYEVSVNAMTPK